MKKKKERTKSSHKGFIITIVIIMLLSISGFTGLFIYKNDLIKNLANNINKITNEMLINKINHRYNSIVITENESLLYKKEKDSYKEVGKIGKDFILTLGEVKIDENTLYFPITNLNDDYYISYNSVVRYTEEEEDNGFSSRYKYYIPFNKNVVTKDNTTLYQDGKMVLSVPEEIDSPILIMDGDKYYVEYNNALYYVLKDEIAEVKDSNNSNERVASQIPTIAYHFIYDPSKDVACDQIICHTVTQVRSHLEYLKKNNYFTLTLEEFELWIDGKLNVPVKSLVITQDDGPYAWNSVALFNEYQIRDNIFIVTAWFDENRFKSDYTGIYSHTDNLHNVGQCPGYDYQGAGMLCVNMTDLVADLKLSREKTSGITALAYPFYGVNAHAIAAMKEAGFTMGFAGYYAGGHANMVRGGDKYRIPRYTFLNDTTVADLAGLLLR